jgi:thiamine kinase-like enzyme
MTAPSTAIDEETALGLITAYYSPGRTRPRVIAQWQGSINQVFRLRTGEKDLALRVRHDERHFQYEKGVFKEVIVAQLLAARERDKQDDLDKAILSIWERTRCSSSSATIVFPAGARILHYDFTKLAFPGPWAIFDWSGDALNEHFGPGHAASLGAMVSQIHKLQFKRACINLHSLHLGSVNLIGEWTGEICRRNESTGRTVSEEQHLRRKLESLQDEIGSEPLSFVFCHNDLQCTNVSMNGPSMHILDWDNAQIAPRELDFVKIAHWSKIGKDGYFDPDREIFLSFCAGYGVLPAVIEQSPIFRLAEILWLFRVYDFAMKTVAAKPFWPAARYASLLGGLLKYPGGTPAVRRRHYEIAPKS